MNLRMHLAHVGLGSLCLALAACSDSDDGPSTAPSGSGPDPLLPEQWHHENTGQNGGVIGEDARTAAAWALGAGFSGAGSRISIIDNGLQIAHPDLAGNVPAGGSKNYFGGTDPGAGDHGTACGGVAASLGDNAIGGRGSGFGAELVGLNLLQLNTEANQVDAMLHDATIVDVSSNSWGPPDTLGVLEDSPAVWRGAIDDGVTTGRGGLGIIYVWAGGNGAFSSGVGLVDDSNYDGYANYYGVMAIGAVGDEGERAFYSERGANLWICAPSQGNSGQGITTTDLLGGGGYNTGASAADYTDVAYTNTFNGTSSATPLVAGAITLMLEANPNLTWSDVRVILAQTARVNDAANPEWTTNGAGYAINHEYGFGVIDAAAAVTAAQTWTSLTPISAETTGDIAVNTPIVDNDPTPISIPVTVSGSALTEIEYVQVYVDIPDHDWWPDLEIEITSPAGTISRLATPHAAADTGGIILPRMDNWRFGVARCLGEGVNGTWTITVRDLVQDLTGTVDSVRLDFYGR